MKRKDSYDSEAGPPPRLERVQSVEGSDDENPFGITDRTYGLILCVGAATVSSICAAMYEVAVDHGISSNCLAFSAQLSIFICAICVDLYFYYYRDNYPWFVLFDFIRDEKQYEKAWSLNGFYMWFLISGISAYLFLFLILISLNYVSDAGDSIAVFDCYPILVPLFGFFVPKKYGRDWKHRYFISLFLIVLGVILIAKPGFLFGYKGNVHPYRQAAGVFAALAAAVCGALNAVGAITNKKVSFYDFLSTLDEDGNYIHNNNTLNKDTNDIELDEETPLVDGIRRGSGDSADSTEFVKNNNFNNNINYNSDIDHNTSNRIVDFEEYHIMPQSTEFIIQNDLALNIWQLEYASLINIILSLFLSIISVFDFDGANELQVFYGPNHWGGLVIIGIILCSLLWAINCYLIGVAQIKLHNGPLYSIIDTIDVFITYVIAFIFLNQLPDGIGITGATMIVVSICVSVYPWNQHTEIFSETF